jgi:outer membrane protein
MLRPLHVLTCLLTAAAAFPALAAAGEAVKLTLEQAYDRALATDQSIRLAFFELKKADLLPASALTRMGPQLSGNAGSQHRQDRRTSTTTTSTASTNAGAANAAGSSTAATAPLGRRTVQETSRSRSSVGTADLTLQQPLIDFSVFPAYRFGKLSILAAEWQQRFTIRETLFGVTTAFYDVIKQQQLVVVNRQALELANEQLSVAEKRAKAGEVTRADVLRTRVTVETARRALVESEAALAINLDILRNALNFPPDAELSLTEPPAAKPVLPDFTDLLQRARTCREDLKVRVLAIEQEEERRKEIRAQYAPRVVAQVNGGYTNDSGTANSRNSYWSAEVSVEVPFFSGGQREIDLKNAGYLIEQSRLERESLEKTVESEVRQAWHDVKRLAETIKALEVQVEAAEQSYRDLRNQYQAGTATNVDVLSALNDLNISRQDLAAQRYDYQVALRNLDRAAGSFQEGRVRRAKLR